MRLDQGGSTPPKPKLPTYLGIANIEKLTESVLDSHSQLPFPWFKFDSDDIISYVSDLDSDGKGIETATIKSKELSGQTLIFEPNKQTLENDDYAAVVSRNQRTIENTIKIEFVDSGDGIAASPLEFILIVHKLNIL